MAETRDPTRICRRCERPVATPDYDTFEQMHYVCFHYEFEHRDVDVDAECPAGGCPSRRVGLRETLTSWTTWDLAAFRLGRAIGLYEIEAEYERAKLSTSDQMDAGLHDAVDALVVGGILERRNAPEVQFRWAPL
jgi:hypothetical protein